MATYYRTRQTRRPTTGVIANRFPGECHYCGETVAAGKGIYERATRRVLHRRATWIGSPVSGSYADGCPGEADKLNTRLRGES